MIPTISLSLLVFCSAQPQKHLIQQPTPNKQHTHSKNSPNTLMEVPRNHVTKKKNSKTMSPAINIGAGAGIFGKGGILLFGGALVTATIVSALAFKTRRQRRSPSDDGKNSRSPSPETQTVDAPNQLEFDSNKDPEPATQNKSDGVTNMKEMQIKPIQNSLTEEKQNYEEEVDSGDGNEKILSSVVGEDQESYVDSGFKGEEFDNGFEKIVVDCEEVMEAQTEPEPGVRSSEEDDGGEEQKDSEPTDEQIDHGLDKSLVSIEAVITIEDRVVDVSQEEEDEEIQSRRVSEDQEQFLEKKEKDGVDEMIPENIYGDLIDGNRIDNEETMAEEGINAASVDFENTRDVSVMADHEVVGAEETQVNKDRQTYSGRDHWVSPVSSIMNLNETLIMAVSEYNSPRPLIVKEEKGEEKSQQVEEQASTDGQVIEEANVGDQKVEREEKGEETAQKVKELMSADGQVIEEARIDDEKLVRGEKDEETAQEVEERVSADGQVIEEARIDDQKVEKEENRKETAQKVEERVSTDVQAIEEAKVDDQKVEKEENGKETAQKVKEQASTTEDEFVKNEEKSKEDEIPLIQSIKEDEEAKDNKEDTKIINLKVVEKTNENKRNLSKEKNGSNNQNGIIEDTGSKRASRYSEPEPWNLKLRTWSILVSIWCLCHWYSELPFPELSLISSFLFILILFRYQNHTTNLIKHE